MAWARRAGPVARVMVCRQCDAGCVAPTDTAVPMPTAPGQVRSRTARTDPQPVARAATAASSTATSKAIPERLRRALAMAACFEASPCSQLDRGLCLSTARAGLPSQAFGCGLGRRWSMGRELDELDRDATDAGGRMAGRSSRNPQDVRPPVCRLVRSGSAEPQRRGANGPTPTSPSTF